MLSGIIVGLLLGFVLQRGHDFALWELIEMYF